MDKPNKALVTAATGAVVTIVAALGVEVEPELASAVATLLAVVLVYVVPNQATS